MEDSRPKHEIKSPKAFMRGREKLGGLIRQNMKTSGGTDIDWLIERNGNFMIMEFKEFHDSVIRIPLGQMIAFERLYQKLSQTGKCYFLVFAQDEEIDFNNGNSQLWYFDMEDWQNNKIPYNDTLKNPRRYSINKKHMKEIHIRDFRNTIEKYWNEFSSLA